MISPEGAEEFSQRSLRTRLCSGPPSTPGAAGFVCLGNTLAVLALPVLGVVPGALLVLALLLLLPPPPPAAEVEA